MKKLVPALAAFALWASFAAAPAAAVSTGASGSHSVTFATALSPQYFGAGEYDGVLHLTFDSRGEVSGWYRPVDVGIPRTVVGGLSGDKLWLNIGNADGTLPTLQLTYDDGQISGGTYLSGQAYSFTGTPVTAPPV